MKVRKAGRKRFVGPWWVGRGAVCEACGQLVELELEDQARSYWLPVLDPASRAAFECGNCHAIVELKKESA
jgi:hypothetical protein